MTPNVPLPKPRWRGVSHLIAFAVALVTGPLLVRAQAEGRAAMAVYAVSLAALFGISALYHLPTWTPGIRAWLRRLDHAAIFALIAGTATPLLQLSLAAEPAASATRTIWFMALCGIGQALFWIKAPKVLTAALYLGMGWSTAGHLPQLAESLGPVGTALIIGGGVVYSLGALVYALRWPDPKPVSFGYHEIFHALVIVAAIGHFTAILLLGRHHPL